jgi:predicted metal-dependent hydrolase
VNHESSFRQKADISDRVTDNRPLSLYVPHVSKKSARIAELIRTCHGECHSPYYVGYFALFNQELFYEAHDVLEELWLAQRDGPNYAFYKGLIQLAGAFVHLQKSRLRPSAALFKLARANLQKYAARYESLDVKRVLEIIEEWLGRLEGSDFAVNPLKPGNAPKIELEIDATKEN